MKVSEDIFMVFIFTIDWLCNLIAGSYCVEKGSFTRVKMFSLKSWGSRRKIINATEIKGKKESQAKIVLIIFRAN